MEQELKTFINLTHGPNSWNEIIALQGKIRKDRQRAIYAQQERRREILNAIGILMLVLALGGLVWFFAAFAVNVFGHPRNWF